MARQAAHGLIAGDDATSPQAAEDLAEGTGVAGEIADAFECASRFASDLFSDVIADGAGEGPATRSGKGPSTENFGDPGESFKANGRKRGLPRQMASHLERSCV